MINLCIVPCRLQDLLSTFINQKVDKEEAKLHKLDLLYATEDVIPRCCELGHLNSSLNPCKPGCCGVCYWPWLIKKSTKRDAKLHKPDLFCGSISAAWRVSSCSTRFVLRFSRNDLGIVDLWINPCCSVLGFVFATTLFCSLNCVCVWYRKWAFEAGLTRQANATHKAARHECCTGGWIKIFQNSTNRLLYTTCASSTRIALFSYWNQAWNAQKIPLQRIARF